MYTREGAHSRPRILFHEDITGKEITSKLAQIKTRKNIQIMEYMTMTDILISKGLRLKHPIIKRFISTPIRLFLQAVELEVVISIPQISRIYREMHLIFPKTWNRLEHLDYVQIHPTTLYSKNRGADF